MYYDDQVIGDDDLEKFKLYFDTDNVSDYFSIIGTSGYYAEKIFLYLLENVDINTPIDVKYCGIPTITHIVDLFVYNGRDDYLKLIRDYYKKDINIDIVELCKNNCPNNDILEILVDIFLTDPYTLIDKYYELKQIINCYYTDYEEESLYKIFRYKYLDLKYKDDKPF
jgi:hypothetical protein